MTQSGRRSSFHLSGILPPVLKCQPWAGAACCFSDECVIRAEEQSHNYSGPGIAGEGGGPSHPYLFFCTVKLLTMKGRYNIVHRVFPGITLENVLWRGFPAMQRCIWGGDGGLRGGQAGDHKTEDTD